MSSGMRFDEITGRDMLRRYKKEKRAAFQSYMSGIGHAAMRHCTADGGLYSGEDGCLRLAREVGYALPDFSTSPRDIQSMASSTYGAVCVIAYNLKPPVSARRWYTAVMEGADRALQYMADGKEQIES